ncbi:hypothetical protein V499_05271 [Pseudogymnoascus sp. VKM F-103]|nr:hypothetical protein V499_05271 [Pseudogymnoascus sp. VKM F-103]
MKDSMGPHGDETFRSENHRETMSIHNDDVDLLNEHNEHPAGLLLEGYEESANTPAGILFEGYEENTNAPRKHLHISPRSPAWGMEKARIF